MSRAVQVLDAADIAFRRRFPYYEWMEGEGIPIHFDAVGVEDLTALPRKLWPRTGKGLGTFVEMNSTFQAERGMFVCEIPPRESLEVQHHLYEQFTLILQGRGTTEIWQKNGPKRTFEWGRGSLFAPPKNTYYRMHNLGPEPVIYVGVTTAPRVFNGLFHGVGNVPAARDPAYGPRPEMEIVFKCDHDFTSLYDGRGDYFNPPEDRLATPEGRHLWYTNFIPNVYDMFVDDREAKVAGGQVTGYRMAGGFPTGHISEWPVGRYHKAHYHGPGAVLIGLNGSGYVNLWPRELGVHPWQNGHEDQVALVEWGANSTYAPPDGWFHQHMSTGKESARHVAVYGGANPLMARGEGDVSVSLREGGMMIEYEDEDSEVRRYFIEESRRHGVECTMPPVRLRSDPFKLPF